MDDLIKCLYEFVQTRRMGSLHADEEYKEYTRDVILQEERVQEYLSEQQQKELHRLVDTITFQDSIERKHLFQATLALSRELNALVR